METPAGRRKNMDKSEENSINFSVTKDQNPIYSNCNQMWIFPGKEINGETEWTGIMAFGNKKFAF